MEPGSYITFPCENCLGKGTYEINDDGADVECICQTCQGSGIESFDREYIEKVFEQRNEYSRENIELREVIKIFLSANIGHAINHDTHQEAYTKALKLISLNK